MKRMLALAMAGTLGGYGDSGGTQDDGNDDPGPVPTIVQTTPEDGASPVGVIADLLVEMSGTLDPKTVNTENVRVFNEYDAILDAPVTWDESTLTITMNPTYPFRHGRPHRLEIEGLKDPHGRDVEPER